MLMMCQRRCASQRQAKPPPMVEPRYLNLVMSLTRNFIEMHLH